MLSCCDLLFMTNRFELFVFADIYLMVCVILGRCDCGKDQEFEAITEMDYSSCNLKEMPVEIPDYSESLLNLSLESNTITELPSVCK